MNLIIQSYIKRKEYVAALLSVLGSSVLEYNTESFKSIAFLFEHQGFAFIAKREKPQLFFIFRNSSFLKL